MASAFSTAVDLYIQEHGEIDGATYDALRDLYATESMVSMKKLAKNAGGMVSASGQIGEYQKGLKERKEAAAAIRNMMQYRTLLTSSPSFKLIGKHLDKTLQGLEKEIEELEDTIDKLKASANTGKRNSGLDF